MSDQFDYRHNLLRAVRGLLDGTPESRTEANDILAACPPTKPFTVGDIVWGSIKTTLKDIMIEADAAYLEHLQRFLLGRMHMFKPGYVHYDLRSDMTQTEYACYSKLVELVDFLAQFPFPNVDDALVEYNLRRAEIEALVGDLPVVEQADHETIHRLVLREVATIALNIDIRLSMLVAKHLAPQSRYVSVQPYHRPPIFPDVTNSINWCRRALASIVGQDWLYLSWHLTNEGLWFSLH